MAVPIDRLPPEILSRIFVILVRASRYASSMGDASYAWIDYPLQVSSVCVRWRQIAINTPMLWSFLDIFRSGGSLRNLEYLNMCYDRSANTTLSLRIGNHDIACFQETVDDELSSLLSTYRERLESLALSYHFFSFARQVLRTLRVGRVRKLALYSTWEDDLILENSLLP